MRRIKLTRVSEFDGYEIPKSSGDDSPEAIALREKAMEEYMAFARLLIEHAQKRQKIIEELYGEDWRWNNEAFIDGERIQMNKTAVDTIEINNLEEPVHLNNVGAICIVHVDLDAVTEYIQPGCFWEREDGEIFIVKKMGIFPNCFYNPQDQIGIVLESSEGHSPKKGDVLHPSLWKYGINPSRKKVEETIKLVEEILESQGAVKTELNADHRYIDCPIYEYRGEYYSVGVIGFDEKPHIVIMWTDEEKLADRGLLEDIEPFPYDLGKEKIVKDVRYAMELEPYPDNYPDY